jgi:hypothetical protein
MAFVAHHHTGDHLPVQRADEEHVRLEGQLGGDVLVRIVPWGDEGAALPQVYYSGFVLRSEGATIQGCVCCHGFLSISWFAQAGEISPQRAQRAQSFYNSSAFSASSAVKKPYRFATCSV